MLTQLFMYEGAQVRTVILEGEPWFVLKDLCDVLEISHAPALKQRLSDDVVSNYPMPDTLGRIQETVIVNEDGMYDVVLESRKAKAREFRKWVTGDVLPSIRKTGTYSTTPQLPQNYKEALLALVGQVEKTELLEAKIEADKPLMLFAESLQTSKDSILVADLAKLLKQNGIEMGEKRLFVWLRTEGYLIKSGSEHNMPTQRSMELKIMEVKTGSRNSPDGTIKITRTPKITGKGQTYFINKFLNQTQAS